jgi:hypothetical protein
MSHVPYESEFGSLMYEMVCTRLLLDILSLMSTTLMHMKLGREITVQKHDHDRNPQQDKTRSLDTQAPDQG